MKNRKDLLLFILKFITSFCILYFGTLAIIGLSSPQSYYSPFIANNINYIDWLRSSYLHACQQLLSLFNYTCTITDKYTLRINSANAIRMVYSCIGYGVMSFWSAFIIANKASVKSKALWIFAGLLIIWCLNTVRITLLLISENKGWSMPLGFDHHTWFNIVAYTFIFFLIYMFDNSQKQKNVIMNKKHPKVAI